MIVGRVEASKEVFFEVNKVGVVTMISRCCGLV